MKKEIAAIDLNAVYDLDALFLLGDYDFKNSAFPMVEYKSAHDDSRAIISPVAEFRIKQDCYSNDNRDMFSDYHVNFNNGSDVNWLQLDKDSAKKLRKAINTKGLGGVLGKISYRLASFDTEKLLWTAHITKIEYYADREKTEKVSEQVLPDQPTEPSDSVSASN